MRHAWTSVLAWRGVGSVGAASSLGPLAAAPDGWRAGLLLRGLLLGLGAAVPIGPVNVEIARRALRGGFLAGFALGCGAVSVDVMYAVLSSLSFVRLLTHPAVSRVIGAIGVVLLGYLAVLCFQGARHDLRADPISTGAAGSADAASSARNPGRPAGALHSAYLTGFLMTLLNPMTLAFWFTVVPGQVPAMAAGGGRGMGGMAALMTVCAGVFLATISWVVTFAGLLGWAGRYRRNWWLAAADEAGGAILVGFAAAGFLRLIRPFI